MPKNPLFLGLDGCKAGWVGVTMHADFRYVDAIQLWPAADFIKHIQKWQMALIDMPVGLVDCAPGIRGCEPVARGMLGAKRSSVFSPPVRQALHAPNYAETCRINAEICGKKISKQAWNIMPKIRELDAILREHPKLQAKIRESHPELCFCVLNGGQSLLSKKRTSEGVQERLALLNRFAGNAREFFHENVNKYPKSQLTPDDIIDAMVLALTAARGSQRGFISIPEAPEYDALGLRMEMVFAAL